MTANNKPVLIYPTEVSDRAVGAIAYWYDEAEDKWNKIEDAYIENNKVYGSLPKSAPVSVFLIKRSTYIDNSKSIYPKDKVFCANGVPVTITEQSDGTVIALDDNGFKTVLPEGTTVVGGTLDGEDIALSSVTITGVTKLAKVHGGSYNLERISTLDNMEININNCDINISGAGNKNRVNNANINVNNSNCTFIGLGESVGVDPTKPLDLTTETWVKNATVNCNNVNCVYAYLGGPNTGLVYVDNVDITVIGGKYDNLLPCGANGKVNNVNMSIDGANVDALSTISRGNVVNTNLIINNGIINSLYCTGESEEEDITGIIDKVGIEIANSTINRLTVGKNNGKIIETADEAKSVITKLNLNNTTVTEYTDNSEALLSNIIVKA